MVCVLEPSADRSGAGSPAQPVLRSDGALCRTGPCRGADHRLHAGAQDHRAHLSLCADGAGGAYPRAGRPYQRLPRRVLAGGAPRHRTAALQWRVARRRLDECPGAGHRCGIPGCRAVGGLPGHDRQHLAAGRPCRARDGGSPSSADRAGGCPRPVPDAQSGVPAGPAQRACGDRSGEPIYSRRPPPLCSRRAPAVAA